MSERVAEELAKERGFTIEHNGHCHILRWTSGLPGLRPASNSEVELWGALITERQRREKVERELGALRAEQELIVSSWKAEELVWREFDRDHKIKHQQMQEGAELLLAKLDAAEARAEQAEFDKGYWMAENAKLREGLRPFATLAAYLQYSGGDVSIFSGSLVLIDAPHAAPEVFVEDFRRAAALLSPSPAPAGAVEPKGRYAMTENGLWDNEQQKFIEERRRRAGEPRRGSDPRPALL